MRHNHENSTLSESGKTDDDALNPTSDETSTEDAAPSTATLGRRGYLGLLGSGVGTALVGSRLASAQQQGSADAGGAETDSSSVRGTDRPSDEDFGWDDTFTDTSWVAAAGDNLNVEKVTTLDPTGAGSITEAFDNAEDGPTVIVFEVGGVIELEEGLRLRAPQTWIAGQTAPAPGIAITKGMFRIHDPQCIVQHISVLPGDDMDEESDGFVIDADDILVDHCSAMWGTDECFAVSDEVGARPGIINTIISEGLYDSIHSKGPHSRGLHVDGETEEVCIMGNLLAHNNRRNTLTRGDAVIANNYIYNHGRSLINFNSPAVPDVSSIGNVFEMGPDSHEFDERSMHHYDATLYLDDNVSIPSGRPKTDDSQELVDEPPIWPSGLDQSKIVSSDAVPEFVLSNVGPRPADRPPVEKALINNRVGEGAGNIIDSQDDIGGYPDYSRTTRTFEVPSRGLLDWIQGYTDTVE